MAGVQKTFMDFVEETTEQLEALHPLIVQPDIQPPETEPVPNSELQTPEQTQEFKPKNDVMLTLEVTKKINRIWDRIGYKGNFDKFLDITVAALEKRDEDYLAAIKGMDKVVLNAYAEIHSQLFNYFFEGNYGDPLGSFYMEHFSYGANGEYYTPWNVALFMAQMMDPKPDEIVCDPTCGSGIMLLATRYVIHEKYGWIESSRYGRNLYGMDISSRGINIAKINMYLTDYIYMICLLQQSVSEVQKQPTEVVMAVMAHTPSFDKTS